MTIFEWLEISPVTLWVKESWGFPFALTLHTLGAATMVGLAFVMWLCVLGMFKGLAPASLRKLIPFIWIGLGVQVISGSLLLTVRPRTLLMPAFWTEIAVIATGAVVTVHLARQLGRVSARTVHLSSTAAIIWIVILLSGRLRSIAGSSGYSTSLELEWHVVWSFALTTTIAGLCVGSMKLLNKT